MKTYIKTLKDKPHHHQNRFALLVSGGFTLIIFTVWSMVMFNSPNKIPLAVDTETDSQYEEGPTSALRATFANSFEAIRANVASLKTVLNNDDQ